jgi:hypothetical protein
MNEPRELPPDIRALIDRERDLPPIPGPARARALARARAALVAGRVAAPSGFGPAPRVRWGAAIALACAAAAAAYEIGTHHRPEDLPPAPRSVAPAVAPREAPLAIVEAPVAVAPSAATPSPVIGTGPLSGQADSAPDELGLLRQARAAVARRDFSAALGPIGEHARRFRRGRLVEEREALRVRALSGLGRTEEARRAADAFEKRFPRSVLLPAVLRMPSSGP